MLGGARALLMHSAHPLVVAGARQTGMYANQPWRRLERTLRQTYTVVFGTREEALAASRRIDDVHRGIKGVDPVTGLRYDARDPGLLLWVHACLVDSFLTFERLTVGRLDAEKNPLLLPEIVAGLRAIGATRVTSSGSCSPTRTATTPAGPRRWPHAPARRSRCTSATRRTPRPAGRRTSTRRCSPAA